MMRPLANLLFPPKCVACGSLLPFLGFGVPAPKPLCADCGARWQQSLLEPCECCGRAVSDCVCMTEEMKTAKCLEFRKLVYYLHGTRNSVQNRMIYRIKDAPARAAVDFLTEELERVARACMKEHRIEPDEAVIIYLPRSRRAMLDRGTDQGRQLARGLANRLGAELLPIVRRTRRGGKAQKHLTLVERRKNARALFSLRRAVELSGRAVFLVDDIVTTGVSMATVARLLRKQGAREIYCFAVASDDTNKTPNLAQPTHQI